MSLWRWTGTSWFNDHTLPPPGSILGGRFGEHVELEDSQLFVVTTNQMLPGFPKGAISNWTLRSDPCPDRFCFGTSCPCGNDAHSGCRNSAGLSAALHLSEADPSVALDQWSLTATNTTKNEFAVLFMGSQQILFPFGDGLRCVGGGSQGAYRFPPRLAPGGVLDWGPGLGELSCSELPAGGCIQAGDLRHFQVWYRDPNGACGNGFNTTNGVSASFGT